MSLDLKSDYYLARYTMSILHTMDDVEQQPVLENSGGRAVPVLRPKRSDTSSTFGIDFEPPCKIYTSLPDRAGQCCFLCLKGKRAGQYIVQVPCLRPTKARHIQAHLLTEVSGSGVTRLME